MDWNQLIPIFSGISTLSVVLLLGIKEWRSGSNHITNEVLGNYKTLDEQQKANILECRDNLKGATFAMHELENKFTNRIATLEGAVGEKDKQLQTLNQIVANRNPELEAILKDIRDFMRSLTIANTSQNEILQKQEKRHEEEQKD